MSQENALALPKVHEVAGHLEVFLHFGWYRLSTLCNINRHHRDHSVGQMRHDDPSPS